MEQTSLGPQRSTCDHFLAVVALLIYLVLALGAEGYPVFGQEFGWELNGVTTAPAREALLMPAFLKGVRW